MFWRPRRATSDERIQAELAKLKQSLSAKGLRRSLTRAILGSEGGKKGRKASPEIEQDEPGSDHW